MLSLEWTKISLLPCYIFHVYRVLRFLRSRPLFYLIYKFGSVGRFWCLDSTFGWGLHGWADFLRGMCLWVCLGVLLSCQCIKMVSSKKDLFFSDLYAEVSFFFVALNSLFYGMMDHLRLYFCDRGTMCYDDASAVCHFLNITLHNRFNV